jgi:Immunoglobulin-like domain of bacterial spore germination
MKKIIIPTIIILVIVILMALVFDWGRRGNESIMLSQNVAATGTTELNSNSTSSMPIVVDYPKDNQEVSSPIKITGKATGNWFFEATFPIKLVDADGNIVASTTGRALTDWATTSFVNFSAELDYNNASSSGPALIILSNDNPSGNPDLSKSIYIPVTLK